VALRPRRVTIDTLRLLDFTQTTVTVEVICSKGTYIRALARDIAASLGTVGHMSALTRTRVGPFALCDSLTIDEIAVRSVTGALLSPGCAIPDAPSLTIDADAARRFTSGQPISATAGLRADRVWVYDPDSHLIGLAATDGSLLRPRLVL
jgi:tRNA pseudouridine55 synthase